MTAPLVRTSVGVLALAFGVTVSFALAAALAAASRSALAAALAVALAAALAAKRDATPIVSASLLRGGPQSRQLRLLAAPLVRQT